MKHLKRINEKYLEQTFSDLMVKNLISRDKKLAYVWSTINAIKIVLSELGQNDLVQELKYRLTGEESEFDVAIDIASKSSVKNEELERLLEKIKKLKNSYLQLTENFKYPDKNTFIIPQEVAHEMLNMLEYITDTAEFLNFAYDTQEEIKKLIYNAKRTP